MTSSVTSGEVSLLLERWVTEGLITAEQADRIRASEHAGGGVTSRHAVPTQRAALATRNEISLVTEALGYVGGLLAVLAAVLIAAQVWQQLPLAARLALTCGAAALLVLAGFAVPSWLSAVGERLRSVLWFLSSIVLFAFLFLAVSEGLGWRTAEDATAAAGGGTLLFALALRGRRRSPLQQVPVRGGRRHGGRRGHPCRS